MSMPHGVVGSAWFHSTTHGDISLNRQYFNDLREALATTFFN